jgi:predicted nucleic acid-binding protein
MLYLDTSLLVTVIVSESETAQARQWLAAAPVGHPVVSPWVLTEFASALSVKQRALSLDGSGRQRAEAALVTLLEDVLTTVPLQTAAFERSRAMCARHELGLRAPDALHLACAEALDAVLCTRDAVQARAADSFGISTQVIGAQP